MTVFYTLKDGSSLEGFFYTNEYTKGKEVFHDTIRVSEFDSKGKPVFVKDIRYPGEDRIVKSHKLKVRTDDEGIHYILWKNERINLEDYDYHCIPILIEEIKYGRVINDRWFIPDWMILTSLMKQPDKFGVMIPPRYATFIFPGTSIGLTGDTDEDNPVPFIPYLCPMREVKDWHYKIKFMAQDPEIRKYTATEEYYFSDFCSLLKCGYLNLFEIEENQ